MSVNPDHQTRIVRLGDQRVAVDRKLATIIERLYSIGIETCSSCEENQPEVAWIQFLTYKDADRFVSIIRLHVDWFDWNNDRVWQVGQNGDDHGNVSIRFPNKDLNKIVRLLGKISH